MGDEEAVFTGERVIPGTVEPDLWNEHMARYRFASLFAIDRRVLDVGCGTGYGAAAIAPMSREVLGFDSSPEAVGYALHHYGTQARFCVGSASAFPARESQWDMVTAFEVIEHIAEWPSLIEEAARVLTPTGVFLVSTPNKSSYGESRKEVGPNPFHVHEFDEEEFRAALQARFRFVKILAQNQQASVVISGEEAGQYGEVFVENKPGLEGTQFFLAICSFQRVSIPSFAYIPTGGNMLKEREDYISSLKKELEHTTQQHYLLQDEYHRDLEIAQRKLDDVHAHLEERTRWAQSLDKRAAEAETRLAQLHKLLEHERNAVRSSRWFQLGQTLNLGPKLPDDPA